MIRKIKTIIKLVKNGDFGFVFKEKFKKFFLIRNKIIRNSQFKDETYREFKKKYKYVLDNFKSEQPVKGEKIWVCWLQGYENAPELVKTCVSSIKKHANGREVVMLTNENYSNYIKLPKYIIEKFEKGIIPYAQFADIIRISLLAKHGGLWMDSTILCTENIPDYITKSPLFVYKEIQLDRSDEFPIVASNWLISSYANNDIIVLTRDLLYEYWKKENKLKNYFIFHMFFKLATEKFEKQWNEVPSFSNVPPHILQFELLNEFEEKRFEQIKNISPLHKLNKVITNNTDRKNTFYDYILRNKNLN